MILIITLKLCAATHKRIGALDIATHSQQCYGGMVLIAARQPSPRPLCPWQRVRMVELATRYRYGAL
jgi:hypothetical protein